VSSELPETDVGFGVMSAVLTAGQSPPIYPQLRTHRCTALTDGMRHFRTFAPHK